MSIIIGIIATLLTGLFLRYFLNANWSIAFIGSLFWGSFIGLMFYLHKVYKDYFINNKDSYYHKLPFLLALLSVITINTYPFEFKQTGETKVLLFFISSMGFLNFSLGWLYAHLINEKKNKKT